MLFDAAAALLRSTSITATSTFYPSYTKGHCRLRIHVHLLLLCALLLSTSRACHISQRPLLPSMARVYADVNQHMPRAYWDYDSVNISWGVLENYEVVRKIGMPAHPLAARLQANLAGQVAESTRKSSRASTSSTTKNALSRFSSLSRRRRSSVRSRFSRT
jgi:hypothetical protein